MAGKATKGKPKKAGKVLEPTATQLAEVTEALSSWTRLLLAELRLIDERLGRLETRVTYLDNGRGQP